MQSKSFASVTTPLLAPSYNQLERGESLLAESTLWRGRACQRLVFPKDGEDYNESQKNQTFKKVVRGCKVGFCFGMTNVAIGGIMWSTCHLSDERCPTPLSTSGVVVMSMGVVTAGTAMLFAIGYGVTSVCCQVGKLLFCNTSS